MLDGLLVGVMIASRVLIGLLHAPLLQQNVELRQRGVERGHPVGQLLD